MIINSSLFDTGHERKKGLSRIFKPTVFNLVCFTWMVIVTATNIVCSMRLFNTMKHIQKGYDSLQASLSQGAKLWTPSGVLPPAIYGSLLVQERISLDYCGRAMIDMSIWYIFWVIFGSILAMVRSFWVAGIYMGQSNLTFLVWSPEAVLYLGILVPAAHGWASVAEMSKTSHGMSSPYRW